MKQKVLSLLLTAGLLLALPACASGEAGVDTSTETPALTDTPAPEGGQSVSTEPLETETPAQEETEPAVSETPSQESPAPSVPASPAVSPSPKPSPLPSPKPSQTPAPSPAPVPSAPTPTPSEPAQGADSTASVDLSAFYNNLVANDADFSANMEVTGDFLTNYYPGLSDISTEQCVIYTPMISAVVCEIARVEVSDSADLDSVKAIFQARIDSQVGTDDSPGGAWYPASIESWKTHAQIVSHGNYIMLIAYEKDADVVSAFDALFA